MHASMVRPYLLFIVYLRGWVEIILNLGKSTLKACSEPLGSAPIREACRAGSGTLRQFSLQLPPLPELSIGAGGDPNTS
jgi:hypothetical protein